VAVWVDTGLGERPVHHLVFFLLAVARAGWRIIRHPEDDPLGLADPRVALQPVHPVRQSHRVALSSKTLIRCSMSTVSLAFRFASRTPATIAASSGAISPSAIALTTAEIAKSTSSAVFTGGRSILIGLPFLSGTMRSMMILAAVISPPSAAAT